MTIRIAGIDFDDNEYDDRGDVLYMSVGPPQAADVTVSTPEGHAVHYDDRGAVIGLTLVGVRWILEHEGAITITWPAVRLEPEQLESALTPA